MIGKVCQRGSDVRRLLGYLFREGRAGEHGLSAAHDDAHLIAAWDGLEGLEPPRRADYGRELGLLASALNAPLLAAGVSREQWAQARPVYHLAISAAEQDRLLTDEQWADVVGEYVHRLGLAPHGDEEAVRWVAVRHADNHVHVVATLARQDGKRVWPRNDFYRAREASLAVEDRYGLTRTSPADRTGNRQTTRSEARRHARQVDERAGVGRPSAGPDREVLRAKVRSALAGARSFAEFTEGLRRTGVMLRLRMSVQDPDEVTGYAVALPRSGSAPARDSGQVWFGGGKLAPDLTLPQLQARWSGEGDRAGAADVLAGADRPPPRLQPSGRQAVWQAASHAVYGVDEQLRDAATGGDIAAHAPAEAAAVAASEILSATASLIERSGAGSVRRAADAYDRGARGLRRQPPVPTDNAQHTRHAAGGLRALAFVARGETRQLLLLMEQLSRLSVTLAALRDSQGRAAQATAARAAAEMLAVERDRRTAAATASARALTGVPRSLPAGTVQVTPRPPANQITPASAYPARRGGAR